MTLQPALDEIVRVVELGGVGVGRANTVESDRGPDDVIVVEELRVKGVAHIEQGRDRERAEVATRWEAMQHSGSVSVTSLSCSAFRGRARSLVFSNSLCRTGSAPASPTRYQFRSADFRPAADPRRLARALSHTLIDPMNRIVLTRRSVGAATLAAFAALGPGARPGRGPGVHRRRSQHRRHAHGARAEAHHVARDRAAVPRAHRDVRGPAARGDHGESARARDRRRARPRARAGTHPRPAARHPGRAQGQHPHDRHADDRRRAGVRRSRAAVRGDADEEPRGRRRDHHRQDAADRARELGRERRCRATTTGSTATASTRTIRAAIRATRPSTDARCSAPADRAPASARTASFWAANVGTETSGSILSPSNQNMLVGIKPTVGRISRYGVIPITADQDTPGPMARTVSRRGDHARRARRRVARPERSGDAQVPAAAGPRLHEVPERRRAEGRAHRHPARVLLRAARRPARTTPRGGLNAAQRKVDGRGDRRAESSRARSIVDPADIPSVVDTDSGEQLPQLESVQRARQREGATTRTARSCSSTA